MSNLCVYYVFAGIFVLSLQSFTLAEVTKIHIDCDDQPTWQNTEIRGQFTNIKPNSILTVQCDGVKPNISFIILQVHSFKNELLIFKDSLSKNASLKGRNIGMHSPNYKNSEHYVSIYNYHNEVTEIYVSIHAYNASAPIPGGCNLVSPIEIDPTMSLSLSGDTIIKVAAQPARFDNVHACGLEVLKPQTFVRHTFYRLFLEEQKYDATTYFENLRKMLTVESIVNNADEMPEMMVTKTPLLKLFSAYPGTGSIYVVVVSTNFGSAVYVPAHLSGCSMIDGQEHCGISDDGVSRVKYGVMLLVGLFLCFFGHRFIKTEIFVMGLLCGLVITHILLAQGTNLTSDVLTLATVASGVMFGAVWWLLWMCSVPMASMLLVTVLLGAITACVFMFTLPDGITLLTLDANYWCIFFILMFSAATLMTFAILEANMLCCAVVGAFLILYPIDMYIGSHVRYVVVNVIRRATVKDYNLAYVSTPCQWRDLLIIFLWISLTLCGFLFQKYRQNGRVPVPPPKQNHVSGVEKNNVKMPKVPDGANERTPLLRM